MSTASKGRSREWLVRDFLEARGYVVFRARASKGPADLLALNHWELLVVAVRKTRWPSPSDRRDIKKLEVAPFIRAMVARTRGKRIEFCLVLDEGVIVPWFLSSRSIETPSGTYRSRKH